jgi:hypothetical protein
MIRQNKKQIESLPEHLQVIALKILNDESEIRVMTDDLKITCKTTREGIHREVVDVATKLYEVYEAEKKFNKHMQSLVTEHYGNEEEKAAEAAKPVKKTIAFGKISIKK